MVIREAAIKKFSTNIRIYWSDCDPAGIAYYGNFFRWFEIAEEELFLTLGFSRTDVMRRYQIGFPRVEATSYSNPRVVPQFSDASELLKGLSRSKGVYYKATCANPKAVQRALSDLDSG